jgi:hypothetical protein
MNTDIINPVCFIVNSPFDIKPPKRFLAAGGYKQSQRIVRLILYIRRPPANAGAFTSAKTL